jgi:flagellar biosynthesis protein FlhB
MARLLAAGTMAPRRLAAEAGSLAWAAALAVGGCLLALGLLDYLYEWWQRRRDLRMSRQEIREEQKKTEGDWRVRHRRRDIGRKLVTRMGESKGGGQSPPQRGASSAAKRMTPDND